MYEVCLAEQWMNVKRSEGTKKGRRTKSVVKTRTVSISMTVRKPFSERPEIGARKLPAAPV